MPIVIFYANGNRDIVKGDSWHRLDESSKFGTIYLTGLADGVKMAVNKSQVVKVIEFTDAEWEELKVKEEADKKKAEDEQAFQRATAMLQQRVQEYERKKAEFSAWEKRSFLKRLFRHNPVIVPPNPVRPTPKVTPLDAKAMLVALPDGIAGEKSSAAKP